MSQLHGAWRALPTYARVGIPAFVAYVAANVIFGVELGTPLWASGLCTWFITAVARIAWKERLASRGLGLDADIARIEADEHRFTEIVSNWDD